MFFSFQGRNRPGNRTQAARRPSSSVHRSAPRARFRVEELESRWLLSTTEVNVKPAEKFVLTTEGNAEAADTIVLKAPDVEFLFAAADAAAAMTTVPEAEVGGRAAEYTKTIVLPNAPNVEVKGFHNAGDPPDMLMIPVTSATGVIRISMKSGTAGQPLFEGIRVLDFMHRELASSMPGPNTMSIDVRLPVWGRNTTAVYVQVGWRPPGGGQPTGNFEGGGAGDGDMGGPPTQTFPYILEITRVPAPPISPSQVSNVEAFLAFWEQSQAANSSGTFGSSTPPVVVNLPRNSDPIDSLPPPPNQPQDGPDIPGPPPRETTPEQPSASLSLPVPVGPLPTRSAAPLGGVLGMSDPVPEVDPHEPARVELATFDPATGLGQIELVERQVVPVAGPEPEPAPATDVVVLGPGGLPMLATVLISTPMAPTSESPVAVKPSGTDPALASSVVLMPVQLTATTSEPGSLIPRCGQSDQAVPSRRSRRASVLPGMTLALALGVGLMLPDLVAAFQFNSPVRPRVRLALLRRALRNGLG